MDKALKKAIDKRMERANRPRDYSGRKIKIGAYGDELVRVGNKWVLRKKHLIHTFQIQKIWLNLIYVIANIVKLKRIRPISNVLMPNLLPCFLLLS